MAVARLAGQLTGPNLWLRSTDGVTFTSEVLTGMSYVQLHPNGQHLLARTNATTALSLSSNGGDTWTALTPAPATLVNALYRHGPTGTLLVGLVEAVGLGTRLARSTDGGGTWATVTVAARDGSLQPGTFVEALDGSVLVSDFGGTLDARAYRSTDAGLTWAQVLADGAQAGTNSAFGRDPLSGVLWFGYAVGFNGRLRRSTDNGATWVTVIASGPVRWCTTSNGPVSSLVARRLTRGDFLLMEDENTNRAWTSPDGVNWTREPVGPPSPGANQQGAWQSGTVLYSTRGAPTREAVFSTDGGATWASGSAIATDLLFAADYLGPSKLDRMRH